MKQILLGARDLGPYLLVELLLPGGSLIALGIFVHGDNPLAKLTYAELDTGCVATDQVTLSYRDLNEGANRLAHLLRQRGITAGALVAVCLDRANNIPLALAAVLKAGAAYVPLDPRNDKALDAAIDLMRGRKVNPAFPPAPVRGAAN